VHKKGLFPTIVLVGSRECAKTTVEALLIFYNAPSALSYGLYLLILHPTILDYSHVKAMAPCDGQQHPVPERTKGAALSS